MCRSPLVTSNVSVYKERADLKLGVSFHPDLDEVRVRQLQPDGLAARSGLAIGARASKKAPALACARATIDVRSASRATWGSLRCSDGSARIRRRAGDTLLSIDGVGCESAIEAER